MNRYEILIYWNDEDQEFIAEAPELPGCMAHGATRPEAMANIQEAMTLWIDTAIELGRNIPQSLTPRIPEGDAVPHEVIGLHVKEGMTYLRAWRKYLGLTQAELAEKAGITQAALSRMESGESKLRKATRQKLALAMGIHSEQLEP